MRIPYPTGRLEGNVRKPAVLVLLVLVALLGSHVYYRWMLGSGIHKDGLHQFGIFGYWFVLSVPALTALPLFVLYGVRRTSLPRWVIVTIGLSGSMLLACLGLYGEWLVCAFLTKDVCE